MGEIFQWPERHWFELLQTAGIIAGLLFSGYTIRKDAQARQIANLIALNERHDQIWSTLYERPKLPRILESHVNLNEQPVSEEERLFVKRLFIHLDTVHRTAKAGLFVEIEGLRKDIISFMRLPIPQEVWKTVRSYHDEDFVAFVEKSSSPQ